MRNTCGRHSNINKINAWLVPSFVPEMATDSPTVHDESNVLRRFYSEIEAVLDPAVVARKLWQDGVLTEGQLDEAELASTSLAQRKSDLMSAVRKVVRGDPGKIWILVNALEQFPASVPMAEKMKEELTRGKTTYFSQFVALK